MHMYIYIYVNILLVFFMFFVLDDAMMVQRSNLGVGTTFVRCHHCHPRGQKSILVGPNSSDTD